MNSATKQWTIGYFNTILGQDWSYGTWRGTVDAARARGVDIIGFHGETVKTESRYDDQRNIIYDLARGGRIDGLIGWNGHLTRLFSDEEAGRFFREYGVPVVVVEGPLAGFPCVTYGNREGAAMLVNHLVGVHGMTKIAFLGLVENHFGFMERYAGFVETMRTHGLEVDPEFVRPYSFWEKEFDGRPINEVLDEWLGELLAREVEAVIAACDPLALWAMDRLERLGASVPEDIAMVGYDAFAHGRIATPPLTSIDPEWADVGSAALNVMVDLLEGKPVPPTTKINTKLLVARSCGCAEETVIRAGRIPQAISASDKDVLAEMAGAGGSLPMSDYAGLLKTFVAAVRGQGDAGFLSSLERGLKATIRAGGDPLAWQDVVSVLQASAVPAGIDGERSGAYFACNQARTMIASAVHRAQGQLRVETHRQRERERELGLRLITTFELAGLLDVLTEGLGAMGIAHCYLSLYEGSGIYRFPEPAPEWARLVLAVDTQGRREIPPEGLRFKSRELVPEAYWPKTETIALAVNPLHFRAEQIGFVIFDAGPWEMTLYDTLRVQLSSALKGVLLVDTIEQQIKDISRTNGLLEKSYRDLKENQQRLLASEKMASLGRLSAGIAHEMNTPLAAVRAALSEINLLTDEYRDSIGKPAVTDADHREIAADILKNVELALRAAERSVGFIRGIKSQSSTRSGDAKQEFDASATMQDALMVLEHLFKHSSCRLETSMEEGVRLVGEPRAFGQIVTNLVMNAVDACGAKGGAIKVSLSRGGQDGTCLRVADNGRGIAPENTNRIFEPFFTTKPFGEGTGLGLSIVQDLVYQFGGAVSVSSVPGETVFRVTFPGGKD